MAPGEASGAWSAPASCFPGLSCGNHMGCPVVTTPRVNSFSFVLGPLLLFRCGGNKYTFWASVFHASVCLRRTFVPLRRGLIIPETDRMVPGNVLIYNLLEASRQKVKHGRKEKTTYQKGGNRVRSLSMIFLCCSWNFRGRFSKAVLVRQQLWSSFARALDPIQCPGRKKKPFIRKKKKNKLWLMQSSKRWNIIQSYVRSVLLGKSTP